MQVTGTHFNYFQIAKRGGSVAGTARKATEKELGRRVVSDKNFLPKSEKKTLDK